VSKALMPDFPEHMLQKTLIWVVNGNESDPNSSYTLKIAFKKFY
jgi:hypothetical protein